MMSSEDHQDRDDGGAPPAREPFAERKYHDTSAYRPTAPLDEESLYLRQHNAYGGVKLGSAFFGWLVAAALIVLLSAVTAGAAAAAGVAVNTQMRGWLEDISDSSGPAAISSGLALVALVLAGYFGGGYVAARMARFDGVRQGLAVWLWGIVMAVVAGVVSLAAGGFGVLTGPAPVPLLGRPVEDLTLPGLIALLAVLLASLAGALLGGAAGLRYHRAVDKSGFEPGEDEL